MKKIIATDMDGTFLKSDHSFDAVRLRKVLNQFKEKGYLFVAASGRSLQNLEETFAAFKDEMAFVAENGSIVSYKGEILFEDDPISPEVYLKIAADIEEGPYGSSKFVLLSGLTGAYMLESADPEYAAILAEFYPQLYKVEDFSQVTEPVIKVFSAFPGENMAEVQDWLQKRFEGITAVTTGFESVDIILSDINKAVGLSKLCDHFGLTGADVVAFGDNQNDVEMLQFAGHSVATANARQLVKDVVHQVIGSCEEGAVLDYLEEYVGK